MQQTSEQANRQAGRQAGGQAGRRAGWQAGGRVGACHLAWRETRSQPRHVRRLRFARALGLPPKPQSAAPPRPFFGRSQEAGESSSSSRAAEIRTVEVGRAGGVRKR
jgi:hypothetical protein